MVDLPESAILLIPHLYRSVLSARRSLMTKLAEILFYRYVDEDFKNIAHAHEKCFDRC